MQISVREIEKTVIVISSDAELEQVRCDQLAHPHYCRLALREAKNWLYKQMVLISTRKSLGWSKEVAMVMTEDLHAMILQDSQAGSLTASEISTALRNGSCGKYGETYRVDVEAMMRWIGGFIEEHRKAYADIMAAQERERRSKMGQQYIDAVQQHADEVRLKRMQAEALETMMGKQV